jgi:putative tricarboxylic transport membrane protein
MKNRDLVSSIIWIVLGGLFVAGALQQGLMRKGVPGPGFLPFLSGVALIFASLFVLIPALRQRETAGNGAFFPERDSFRKILLSLAALVAFGVVMEYAGFVLTTFFFMLFVTRIMEPNGWRLVTVLALLTAAMSYLLFVVLMEVQLPKGLLGF